MAARFVVGLALFALCHSSPVQDQIREGRGVSIAQGQASGYGGLNRATANVRPNEAQSTSYSNGAGAGLARDGYYGQGQAIANAQTYDSVEPAAVDIAKAQQYYQPLPIAQPISYHQNYIPAEQFVYQPLRVASGAPSSAESIANTDGNFGSSQSTSSGFGQSNAQTLGAYGQTNTNAKTYNGYNSADSNAKTSFGPASVSSKASGSEYGTGFASSNAQANGLVAPIAIPAPIAPLPSELPAESAIIAAKNQGFYNPALAGSASSNAIVNGYGNADASAKILPTRRSISWRFGTAYDTPAGYGAIKSAAPIQYHAAPVVYQPTPIVYQATPVVYQGADPTIAKSSANARGQSTADSKAYYQNGISNADSTANSNGGSSSANADINNRGYGLYRTAGAGEGAWGKTFATSNGVGNAHSNARGDAYQKIAQSSASSHQFGSANANSHIQ